MCNTGRYDDPDVVITNLLDSYDRLMKFGVTHLNDLFTFDGTQRVSSRDAILREVIANLLIHRDFSSGYVSKLVIEGDQFTTENPNLAHGHGILNLKTFKPYAKKPPLSRVFREIGLAEELGSGMRNIYKYTTVLTEGEVFTVSIPLLPAAVLKSDTTKMFARDGRPVPQYRAQYTPQDTPQDRKERWVVAQNKKVVFDALLAFCSEPKSREEMMRFVGLRDSKSFRANYLVPLLKNGLLQMTIPDKPDSKYQRYVRVK